MDTAKHIMGTSLLGKLAGVMAGVAVALAFAFPSTAYAALPRPDYSWYVGHEAQSSFTLEDEADFLGFINLVNGTTDGVVAQAVDFAGKTVVLASDLSYSNIAGDELIPVGTAEHPFSGVFDGDGCEIGAYNVHTVSLDKNIGLFGYVATKPGYPTATIQNLSLGSGASLQISRTAKIPAEGAVQLANIGSIVGYIDGDLINCTSTGRVTIFNAMDQTPTEQFAVKNVGGLAGICLGNITSCVNSAVVDITSTGGFNAEAGYYTIIVNVGGIVGCFGDEDSSINSATTRKTGTISGCVNTDSISAACNMDTYEDRFGNKSTTLQIAAIGGIAGYSRGSIINCENAGAFNAQRSRDMGGIVGMFRTGIETSNFVSTGTDDGMAASAPTIVVRECDNRGSLVGYAFVGGIVGRAGTKTVIEACTNGLAANGSIASGTSKVYVLATRVTKPFPAGIAGATYGTIRYCGNFAEVGSAVASSININNLSTYTGGAGYYAAGICGIVQYYTNEAGEIAQAMPELYGCFNAGDVKSQNDAFRNRSIVGDNEGYVHDCIAVDGTAPEMYFSESSLGTVVRCYEVSAALCKSNDIFEAELGLTPIAVLNAQADNENWAYYWTTSDGAVNNGFVVLSNQVSWSGNDLSSADVSLVADAEYTGLEAVPSVAVVLHAGTPDEVTLTQNVDFRVVPQVGAIDTSYETVEKDYTATVVGIGNYSGTALQTVGYDIVRGNLANCTVVVDNKLFNWEGQTPSVVTVRNPGGLVVDVAEYTFSLDAADPDLTEGQAVNVATYTVQVEAADNAVHYYGSVTGEFAITPVKVVWGDENINAIVQGLNYLGESLPWQSTSNEEVTDANRWTAAYTGHAIKPEVSGVRYLNRDMTANTDYRVYYGSGYQMAGDTPDPTPNTEPGDGWILVRGAAGGNFTNYDLMKFVIAESGPLDIAAAVVPTITDVIYESGSYTPVKVFYGGAELTEGVDYTVAYEGNDAIGQASYTVTGTGLFTGTISGTFNLVAGKTYELLYAFDEASSTATVTGVKYFGSLPTFALEIPATVEENGVVYTVTTIADNAFGGSNASSFVGSDTNISKQKIGSVTIPATVTTIGDFTFGGPVNSASMAQLTAVTFAAGSQLATIETYAFASTGITEVIIPASVASIGNGAFATTALTSVTFESDGTLVPTIVDSRFSADSFYGVQNVQAKAYSEALAALQTAVNDSTWTWVDLGSAAPTVLWGDLDGDGQVKTRDAVLLAQYLAESGVEINLAAADVDGNGKVNGRDFVLLKRYLAGDIDQFPVEAA